MSQSDQTDLFVQINDPSGSSEQTGNDSNLQLTVSQPQPQIDWSNANGEDHGDSNPPAQSSNDQAAKKERDWRDIGNGVNWQADEFAHQRVNSSDSRIADHLANLHILIDPSVVPVLNELEMTPLRRTASRRADVLRWRHRNRTVVLNTDALLRSLLDQLLVMDHSTPKVIVDTEGFCFEETKPTIDVMELFVRPLDSLYLVDIVTLGSSWSTITATDSTFDLATFLSSNVHKKIMWDLRADAHVLSRTYDIRLRGIVDSSLWEIVSHSNSDKTRRVGNMDAVERLVKATKSQPNPPIDQSELDYMDAARARRIGMGRRLWHYRRPIYHCLIDYAADVKHMGVLYDYAQRRLERRLDDDEFAALAQQIDDFTNQDLEFACDPVYDIREHGSGASPWAPRYFELLTSDLAARKTPEYWEDRRRTEERSRRRARMKNLTRRCSSLCLIQ